MAKPEQVSVSNESFLGAAVIAGAIIVYFLLPVILAAIVYVLILCMIAGSITIELRIRNHAKIIDEDKFIFSKRYYMDELSDLSVLKAKQAELLQERRRVYLHGDSLGLKRRGSDGRFFARGEGRFLNERLSSLDDGFKQNEYDILRLNLNEIARRQEYADQLRQQRYEHSLRWAFRAALITYFVFVSVFAMINPNWSQEFSEVISRSIWHSFPVLERMYGPLLLAPIIALAVAFICQMTYTETSYEISTEGEQENHDEHIRLFLEPEEIAEPEECGQQGYFEAETERNNDEEEKQESPHEILGVSPRASREEIMAAYRELVKQYHPDFQQNRGPKLKELAERETQKLNWAKEEALKQC